MRKSLSVFLQASASVGAILWASAATAQSKAPPAPVASQDTSADTGNDIVVTANKREQNLNDVALSVTAIAGDQLKEKHIVSLGDLANAVPGLSYSNSQEGTPVLTLRGVGFYSFTVASFSAVSSYVDQIPLSFPVMTRHAAFDLDRVEVLKGPQGTLFGENSTGGAINYVVAKPTSQLRAGLDIDYGNYNTINAEGFVSGPISDTLRFRVSGRMEHASGWQESLSRPGDHNGKVRNWIGRGQLDYQPSSSLHFLLSVSGWKENGDTIAGQVAAINVVSPAFSPPYVLNANPAPPRDTAADWTPGIPYENNSFFLTSLRSEYKLSSDLTVTALTAFMRYSQDMGVDEDGLPASTFDWLQNAPVVKEFSQELRLANNPSNRLRWIVGLNYEHSSVDQQIINYYPDISNIRANIAAGRQFIHTRYTTEASINNYAGFANFEYDASSNVTLRAGGRYTRSINKSSECTGSIASDVYTGGDFFYDVLLGGRLGKYPRDACYSINDLGVTNNGVLPGNPGEYAGKLDQGNFSWRAGLDWKVRPGLLLYTNIARGYKAGSFPTLVASNFSQDQPVSQESVTSYEAGFKGSFFNRHVQLNAAGFYLDYRDKQLLAPKADPLFKSISLLQNVPRSRIVGAEAELTIRPVHGLTLFANGTYLDGKILDFVGINVAGVQNIQFAGQRLPFTSKWQGSVGVSYETPVSDTLLMTFNSQVDMRTNAIATINDGSKLPNQRPLGTGDFPFNIDGYAIVNGSIGIRTNDGRWRLSVWGKNILNKYYWDNAVKISDTTVRYTGMPATYGVTVGFRY